MQALCMSMELETAFAEYHQDIQRPGALCRYDADVAPASDLRGANILSALGATAAELQCA